MSVRLLAMKISQRGRENFCSYSKKENGALLVHKTEKDESIRLRLPRSEVPEQHNEKRFVCLFVFRSALPECKRYSKWSVVWKDRSYLETCADMQIGDVVV